MSDNIKQKLRAVESGNISMHKYEPDLVTDRLELVFLTEKLLSLWINNIDALEHELNCTYKAEPMNGIFKEIVINQYESVKKDVQNYMWHSFVFLIRKSDRVVVGSADFKNIPDKNGEVEIGYGLGKDFFHNGYMTETVKEMCKWAFSQTGVKHIIAETEIDGISSQNVLKSCGFVPYIKKETMWWKL